MQIFIRSLSGKNLLFNVEAEDSVENLKQKLFEKDGVKPDDQRLVFGGRQLENGNKLSDYGVQENSTIVFVLKLIGGK